MLGRSVLGMAIVLQGMQGTAQAEVLKSRVVEFADAAMATTEAGGEQIVLRNDGFVDSGGQAFLQQGFIKGEKAGIFVKVPANVRHFKIDYFRVLIGSGNKTKVLDLNAPRVEAFFEMGIADEPGQYIPRHIENAAQLSPGNFWNDIPAIGEPHQIGCATGGQYIGAALEFMHDGLPSVYRDADGLSNMQHNLIYALTGTTGDWRYSAMFGVRGDWILRVVGHEAADGECIN